MEGDKIGRSIWQDLAAYFRCDSVGGACLLLCAVSLPLSRRDKRPSRRMMLTDVLSPIVIQISGLVRRPHYLRLVSVCIEFVTLRRNLQYQHSSLLFRDSFDLRFLKANNSSVCPFTYS